jgi:hypothetical protein
MNFRGAGLILLLASAAEAEPGAPLEWRWRRFGTEEYVVTGGAALVAVGSLALPAPRSTWRGGIGPDEEMRSELALPTYRGRRAARDASDVLLSSLIAHTVLADAVVVASGHHGSDDVMEQMLLIDAEVLAIAAAVQGTVSGLTQRERPYGRTCGEELDGESRDCRRRSRYRSFFSGHATLAFAAAGLTCSHHMNLDLYGGGTPDAAACAAALAGASAVAALRVMADVHYASDVALGTAWGSLAGFGLPWLLHYGSPRSGPAFRLRLVPVAGGAGIGGSF